MIKPKRKALYFFLTILIISFIFVFVNHAFARVGSGGGSFRSYRSHGSLVSRGEELDRLVVKLFFRLKKSVGLPLAILIFLPMTIIHIFSCFSFSYYYNEGISRYFNFLLFLFFGSIFYTSCLTGSLFAVSEIGFTLFFFSLRNQYGRFVTKIEREQLDYKDEFQQKEVIALKDFLLNNPTFSLDDFKKRIEKAFKIIQDSWMKQELADSEMFLADGTYEKFKIQINDMKEKNLVDIIKELEILNIFVIKTESYQLYDSMYVGIQAKAIKYLYDKKDNNVIKGNNLFPGVFAEVWCFMRRKGAKNLSNKGLLEGFCPNCGNRIEGSRLATCQFCNAFLRSGQHDWVLTGIYQASEWRDSHNLSIPCLDYLMVQDPGFNIQNIEDKISAIFWRLIEAMKREVATPILKISTDEFVEKYTDNKFFHPLFKNYDGADTDSIEILNIGKDKDKLILLAQVIWNGYLPKLPNTIRHKKFIFVLRRDINATTDINKSFCSTHCSNCGAAETYNGSNLCEYCNTAVNDDKKDWILSDIFDSNDKLTYQYYNLKIVDYETETLKNPSFTKKQEPSIAQDTITSKQEESKTPSLESQKQEHVSFKTKIFKKIKNLTAPNNKVSRQTISANYHYSINWYALGNYSSKDLLRLFIAVMLADGVTDSKEMEILRIICRNAFISEDELQKNIFEMQGMINPIDYALDTTAIKLDKNLLRILIEIAASDGKIADSELKLLRRIADKMQLPEKDFRDAINEVYGKNWEKGDKKRLF